MTADHRRRRQRETIVAAVAAGDTARASALLAEHVLEFPDDAGLLGVDLTPAPETPAGAR